MSTEPHLNSLGYVVGGKHNRPLIAWGLNNQSVRIGIDEALRGGAQGLNCECGALLVAKKGEVKAHHFAHKAGTRFCEAAANAAAVTFISDALLDVGAINLPLTGGLLSQAEVHAVSVASVQGFRVHLIDAQRGRNLLVFAKLKRQNIEPLRSWCRQNNLSGVLVDLTSARNQADDAIRREIRTGALRTWLFRSSRNDLQAKPGILRRIYLRA